MAGEEKLGDAARDPTRIELLKLDVDTRLLDLWREADKIERWDIETVADYMRAAYGKGYYDALSEPIRGQLIEDHGYRTPQRPSILPDLELDT